MQKGGDYVIMFLSTLSAAMFVAIIMLIVLLADSHSQVTKLTAQIADLNKQVQEHEEVMRTYEFFNKQWENGAYKQMEVEE